MKPNELILTEDEKRELMCKILYEYALEDSERTLRVVYKWSRYWAEHLNIKTVSDYLTAKGMIE